jgi:chorismate synthase
MKNTFGNSVTVTLAGESHGEAITVILDGLKPGVAICEDDIASRLALRRPAGTISTPRREADEFRILSGVFEGKTTGTPLCILIPNTAKKSADYDATRFVARPGHADYTAAVKYGGYQDFRGGGHFSGRITAGLVAAGAVAEQILAPFGIKIGTHIARIGTVSDRDFGDLEADIAYLSDKNFPVLDTAEGEAMREAIETVRMELDSVGGILETAVLGVPAGLGEPWFDSVESRLSHILFSIPAVKGVEFGQGFGFADLKGSEANDPFRYEDGTVVTETNRNGGINGGITNGMPLVFRCAVKPTPSIGKEQKTVDLREGKETTLSVGGRHDPCIVHRAASVVNACTALVLLDLLSERYGTNWEF